MREEETCSPVAVNLETAVHIHFIWDPERRAKKKDPVSVELDRCVVSTRAALRTRINLPSAAHLLKE